MDRIQAAAARKWIMFAWQTLDPNITAQVIRRLLRPLLVRAGRGLNKQFQADDMLTEVRQLPANTSAGLFAELPEKTAAGGR
jgi:hypothetical protein